MRHAALLLIALGFALPTFAADPAGTPHRPDATAICAAPGAMCWALPPATRASGAVGNELLRCFNDRNACMHEQVVCEANTGHGSCARWAQECAARRAVCEPLAQAHAAAR